MLKSNQQEGMSDMEENEGIIVESLGSSRCSSPSKMKISKKSRKTSKNGGGMTPLPTEEEDLEESSRKRIGTNEIIADQLKKRNRNQILNIPLTTSKDAEPRSVDEKQPKNAHSKIPSKPSFKIDGLSPEELEKLLRGMQKVIELDAVLTVKNNVARQLKKQRQTPQQQQNSYLSDEDVDDTSSNYSTTLSSIQRARAGSSTSSSMASLKSFDQYTVDNNTFITEAKLKDKLITGKIGRNYGSFTRNSEGVSDMSATSNRVSVVDKKHLKGYKKGDFIERNIVLGGEARYYDAMTEEEKYRVEVLLNDQQFSSPENRPKSASTSNDQTEEHHEEDLGYLIPQVEAQLLENIDRSLQSLIPQSQWEIKSISSNNNTSGIRTPSTSVYESAANKYLEKKNVNQVLKDMETLLDPSQLLAHELSLLAKIDEKLLQFQNPSNDEERLGTGETTLSRSELDRLLLECMEYEEELRENLVY